VVDHIVRMDHFKHLKMNSISLHS